MRCDRCSKLAVQWQELRVQVPTTAHEWSVFISSRGSERNNEFFDEEREAVARMIERMKSDGFAAILANVTEHDR
jgi:hypothetical protein